MVSSCPTDWDDSANMAVESLCSNGSQDLPPVTDMITGLVYKNEHCALCNRVTELVAWTYRLVCREIIYRLIRRNRLANILNQDPEILKRECSVCSFVPPIIGNSSIIPLRSCVPSINTCLPHHILETRVNKKISKGNYQNLARQCKSGHSDLVIARNTVYRNRTCAECNGESLEHVECFELESRSTDELNNDICQVPPITTELPITISTTEFTVKSTPPVKTKPTPIGDRRPNGDRIPNGERPREGIRPAPEAIRPVPTLSYTVTLSSLGDGQVAVTSSDETTTVSIVCPEGEVLVGFDCRPTHCPEGYSLFGGRCSFDVYVNMPPDSISGNISNYTNCSDLFVVKDNKTYIDFFNDTIFVLQMEQIVEVIDYDELGHPIICGIGNNTGPLNCATVLVTLNESDYTDLKNGSILFQNEAVMASYQEDGRPVICADLIKPPLVNNQKLLFVENLPGIQALTYVGCSLSLIGSATIFITYLIFKELKTFPGIVLMNICVAVFMINALYIAGGPAVQHWPSVSLCSTIAILLHYFYLAQFSWMSIFSLETTRSFYQAQMLIKKSSKNKIAFFGYFMIGWILPLAVSIVSVTLNFTTALIQYGTNSQGELAGCWINHYYSLIVVFLVPLVLSLATNLVLMVIITAFLFKVHWDQSKVDKSSISTIIRVWLAIFTITGLTWIFGFIAISKHISWMWYPFVAFNSSIGLFMFLAFIFTKKVFNLYRGLVKKTLGGRNHRRYNFRATGSTQRSKIELVSREDSSSSLEYNKMKTIN